MRIARLATFLLATLSAHPALAQVAGKIVVYPQSSTLESTSTRQFSAYVPISPNTVAWLVNGVPGGNETVGTITPQGLYKPPAVIPSQNLLTITAKSTAFPKSAGSAALTITRAYPWLWSVSPSAIPLGSYSTSFNGSNFARDSQALANGAPVQTTFVSSTKLVVAGTSAQPGTIQFAVRQPGPGAVTGNTVNAQVAAVSVSVTVSPSAAQVLLGTSRAFAATVTGGANTAVAWSVNGTPGGSSSVGTISPAGVYTAPAAMPAPNVVTIRATSAASPASFGQVLVTLSATPPPATSLAAARFLEQSSFGPTPGTLARVQQIGIDAYLDEQFGLPETVIPAPANNSMSELRQWMLHHYTAAPDQLRQRVAYSLSQIVVTSANKLVYADEMLPWLRLLSQHAFGNYRDLLREVSTSASMGKYLDLANSMKPGMAGGANENYPRELMQLFTIGLWELNPDGSLVIGPNGSPVPTYDQATVQQVALALTGWTYATAPGATPRANNWEYFGAPMEARPGNHATTAKGFLGCSLSSGQSVQHDLDGVIDCLVNHHNTAPFIATRLIRSLVTSNPSPAYVKRVADVFAGTQGGAVGDMKAVLRAILTDPEARRDTAGATEGRLKEPILQTAGLLRALNGQFSSTHGLTYLFDYMAQAVLAPPSVFSWFSPLYRMPGSALFGPEFQIYSPTEATLRGNLFHMLLTNPGGAATPDLSPFQAYGNDMPNLVEAVNQVLLYGRMPAGMKQALIAAAAPGYDANTRITTVVYLTALSGQYAVQY